MTFGKFVSSFMYYCDNGPRFQEKGSQRQRRICEARRLLRGVIQDEVTRICSASAEHQIFTDLC